MATATSTRAQLIHNHHSEREDDIALLQAQTGCSDTVHVSALDDFGRWRPGFHLIAPPGWMNDPCAPAYDAARDEYHVAFQWNPSDVEWDNISWGCATSRDMVSWDLSQFPSVAPETDGNKSIGVFTGCMSPSQQSVGPEGTIPSFYTAAVKFPIRHTLKHQWGQEAIHAAVSYNGGKTWSALEAILCSLPGLLSVGYWETPRKPYTASSLAASGTKHRPLSYTRIGPKSRTSWEFVSALANIPLSFSPNRWSWDFGVNWEVTNLLSLADDSYPIRSHDFVIVGVEGRVPKEAAPGTTGEMSEFRQTHAQMWMCGQPGRKESGGVGMCYQYGGLLDHGTCYATNSFWDPKINRYIAIGWVVEEDLPLELRKRQGWSGAWKSELKKSGSIHVEKEEDSNEERLLHRVGCIISRSGDRKAHTSIFCEPDEETVTINRSDSIGLKGVCVASESAPHPLFVQEKDAELRPETPDFRVFFDSSILEVFVNGRTAITTRVYPESGTWFGLETFFDDAKIGGGKSAPGLVPGTMVSKRRREDEDVDEPCRPPKRPRLPEHPNPSSAPRDCRDRLSALSDELILRILSFLPLSNLLSVSPVSHKLHQLSVDSSLWRALYYSRFVLPRALRIPGFRDGTAKDGKLHYSSRRTVWADGRRGGLVQPVSGARKENELCWKRQYRLRHNWSKGKCAVEELLVGSQGDQSTCNMDRKTLAKVVDGLAVTADLTCGLRAWDLRTREVIAQISLRDARGKRAVPTALAADQKPPSSDVLEIGVGFEDGGFGVWRLYVSEKRIIRRYRHDGNAGAGELVAVAISLPFLLIATESVQISLYSFTEIAPGPSIPTEEMATVIGTGSTTGNDSGLNGSTENIKIPDSTQSVLLRPPRLITTLKSTTSRAPLVLSIRQTATTVAASVAYTFTTLQGWSVGIQDLILDVSSVPPGDVPKVVTSRVAYTEPISLGGRRSSSPSGPTTLCYSHPYLLVTLPDNTLFLYLCVSTSTALSIGPGMRLFGHTSGIGDAEITARGKAVSVSRHGEEILVWELEGRIPRERPAVQLSPAMPVGPMEKQEWDVRRSWVGFDDEMHPVLLVARLAGMRVGLSAGQMSRWWDTLADRCDSETGRKDQFHPYMPSATAKATVRDAHLTELCAFQAYKARGRDHQVQPSPMGCGSLTGSTFVTPSPRSESA
ncbi:hypothetical protein MKZ38_004720 [Zalerion maritima]|uniref:F-box domain-containing protein n=1 Tax=Zalerion maritima TaxID=339359 RepID=A0AAD5WWC3_9PEZI|nr:hypothetical protein MKZ38_004720 [Zalerion maritima]